jgi:adiponectin receptor
MEKPTSRPRAKKTQGGRSLLFEETPLWMQVDPRIRRGYREELSTFGACILSLFYVHNEFVNIWSHFLPAIVHLYFLTREAFLSLEEDGNDMSRTDAAMVQLFVLSAIICLLSSVSVLSPGACSTVTNLSKSAYHALKAHSERVARGGLKMDYLGIVLVIGTTSITSTWFGLREQPNLRTFYITSSIGISGLVFYVMLSPKADGASSALWR